MDNSYLDGVVATPSGTQANSVAITRTNTRVVTVASTNDSVVLPIASGGLTYRIVNAGANNLKVWPALNDAINGGSVNAGVVIVPTHAADFNGWAGATILGVYQGGNWTTVPGPIVASQTTGTI